MNNNPEREGQGKVLEWNGEAKYEQELSTIVLVIVKKVRVMKRGDSNFLFSMLEMASGLYTYQWPHKGHTSQESETSFTPKVEEQSGYSHGGSSVPAQW